jgi:hypothetical protein
MIGTALFSEALETGGIVHFTLVKKFKILSVTTSHSKVSFIVPSPVLTS